MSTRTSTAASTPDGLTLAHHRDFEQHQKRPLARWIALSTLSVLLALGVLNVFGQRPVTSAASVDAVDLELYSPTRVRGGLYFMSRFTIVPQREVEKAVLVLDPGWLEGMTLNTVEPAPVSEASRDGRLALSLGRLPAGETYVLYLHFQVNPTNVGRRSQDVDLLDGERRLVHLDRSITIYP